MNVTFILTPAYGDRKVYLRSTGCISLEDPNQWPQVFSVYKVACRNSTPFHSSRRSFTAHLATTRINASIYRAPTVTWFQQAACVWCHCLHHSRSESGFIWDGTLWITLLWEHSQLLTEAQMLFQIGVYLVYEIKRCDHVILQQPPLVEPTSPQEWRT